MRQARVGLMGLVLMMGVCAHADEPSFRHAYYLFVSGHVESCGDCYVPLLLTGAPLRGDSQAADAPPEIDAQVIVTYERDSIWTIAAGPRRIAAADVDASARILRMDGMKYRYQEVPLEEAIRLLRNPMGTMPISRPGLPDRPTDERVQSLLKRCVPP